jgi:hypothetical protein
VTSTASTSQHMGGAHDPSVLLTCRFPGASRSTRDAEELDGEEHGEYEAHVEAPLRVGGGLVAGHVEAQRERARVERGAVHRRRLAGHRAGSATPRRRVRRSQWVTTRSTDWIRVVLLGVFGALEARAEPLGYCSVHRLDPSGSGRPPADVASRLGRAVASRCGACAGPR